MCYSELGSLKSNALISYYMILRVNVQWTVKNPIGHFKWEVLSNSAMLLKVVKTVHGYLLLFH